MKYAILLAVFASLCVHSFGQEKLQMMIAVKDATPVTNYPQWMVEAGEVYRFVRFMGRAEFKEVAATPAPLYRGGEATAASNPSVQIMIAKQKLQKVSDAARAPGPNDADHSYIVAAVGHAVVIVPADVFAVASNPSAESVYWKEVEIQHADEAAAADQRERRETNQQLSEMRNQLEQLKRQQQADSIRPRK